MDSPNLATLDLNLLHVFHVMMEDGSATRTAQRLGQIERALAPRRFSPEDSHRTFHICAPPYAASILLPRVVGRCCEEAPNAKLAMRAWDQTSADSLDMGRADIAIGIFRSPLSVLNRRSCSRNA